MAHRVNRSGIDRSIGYAKKLKGYCTHVIVSEEELSDVVAPYGVSSVIFDKGSDLDASLAKFDFDKVVFILCYNSDYKAVECASRIKERGGRYIPARNFENAKYCNLNENAKNVITHCTKRDPPKAIPEQWEIIIQAIDMTKNTRGDYVEIGVYKGSSAKVAYDYFNVTKESRACYFLDTFEGFNYEESKISSDASWAGTHYVDNAESLCKHVIESREHEEKTATYKLVKSNICQDDLPIEIDKISLCNIDTDLYEAVLASLRKCYPLLNNNGIMIVQDPGRTPYLLGARLALEEFCNETDKSKMHKIYFPSSGQTYIIKNE